MGMESKSDISSNASSLDNLQSADVNLNQICDSIVIRNYYGKFVVNRCNDGQDKRPKSLESKNNLQEPVWIKRGSQNNLNLCNGSILTTNEKHGLVPKVQNNSPNGQKKPTVALTHLLQRPPVDIEFQKISYSVSEGRKRGYKTILKGINGKFRSGELTAIMGPSGAGKSTLLNILTGYKTSNLSGSVLINGKDRNLRRFRKLSCYIMQDDRLLPYLTVREAMMVSANLKLGKDLTIQAKKIIVEEIIDALGLSEASNTQTELLSGGQRKRLSVALELVNNPPIMFFDEPTSGLDSSSCFQLISLLKSLARGGRTICCTIHQPSARLFEMFDYLYMLAEGQCIYQGRVNGLVPFLSSMGYECPSYHNPADYVMEVACGEHGECVHKLVMAVNNGKCNNYNQPLAQETDNFVPVSITASSSNEKSNTTLTTNLNDSVVADVANELDLMKNSEKTKKIDFTIVNVNSSPKDVAMTGASASVSTVATTVPQQQLIGPTTSLLLDSSTESVIEIPQSAHKNHISGFPTSSWTQFWILLKRTFLTSMRDQTLTHMRLLSHIIVGAIIGMIYYDIGGDAAKIMSNAGCIFFTILFVMFTSLMPVILTFPNEMSVFIREHLNYWYSLKSYYFAKTVADLPFQILFTSIYVIVVYYLTSQPMEISRICMFVLICNLTSLVAQSLGLLIGAGMSVEAGVFLGPVTTIPTILFSGFFVNFDVIPNYLKWVTYISYVRFGFEGAMVSVYGFDRAKLECDEIYCHYRSPKKFLETLSMENAEFWIDAAALAALFVGLRIIAYFVLRWKLHSIR